MSGLRRFGCWSVVGLVVLVVALTSLSGCLSFELAPEEVVRRFDAAGVSARHVGYRHDGRSMHSVEVGDRELPLVLFVHGSPGSWDNFIGLMTAPSLARRARLVSVDRPGFGRSDRGRAEPSIARQAAAIAPILDSVPPNRPVILVGHSLGGPVVAQMALDRPSRVTGLVLVAASMDPALESLWWIQHPANWPALAWLVPRDLRTCNREILPLRADLEGLATRLPEIRARVVVLHGEQDRLVPVANADFTRRRLPGASVRLVSDMNHFVPWTRPELIEAAILELLDEGPAPEDA